MKHISSKPERILLAALISLVSLILITVLVYICYVVFSYSRIDDNITLEVTGNGANDSVKTGEVYTIITQNLGFGAYTPEFTFFMDGGTESRAESADSVRKCIADGADTVESFSPDFILFQEVDTDSTRSFHIDERAMLESRFSSMNSVFAVNYHSAYLMFPLNEPHGASNAGILTLGRYKITSAVRRSFPISTGFGKFLDLDRCYSVSRVPVEGGAELVIYNVHMSAYGGSDEIRAAQMNMLFDDMKAEYEAGNYCVCGGDFNHDFTGDSNERLNGDGAVGFEWAQPFPADMLPDCISRCTDYSGGEYNPTCRNCDIPYEEGNFTIIVDGFLVTDNVEAVSVSNIYTGFAYSDHGPVVLQFRLK